MPRSITVVCCLLALSAACRAQTGSDVSNMRTVLDRYRTILIRDNTPSSADVRKDLNGLRADGTWADIDYACEQRSGWNTVRHLSRLRNMSFALVSGDSKLHDDPRLLDAINSAVDHWLEKRYRNPNWWWNEIGVPRTMRDITILLGRRIDEDRRQGMIEVVGQHRMRGTGANLMWSAELALHHGCLSGETGTVSDAVASIVNEIKIGDAEGIQNDFSFYQHNSRLQAFHYGRSYLDVVCKLGWQVRGTPWAFPEDKLAIVSDYIIEGLQWMCRGVYTVPGTMDRQAARLNSMRSADIRSLLELWRDVHPQRRSDINAFLERQEGKGAPLVGFRHFPASDFTAYHRPGFSMFVKTISDRTLPTESINDENLKGRHLHSGDGYLLMDGMEYHNLQPVWNWEMLPGVTLAEGAPSLKRQAFVGGVGNGESGLSVMDYRRIGDDEGRNSPELSVRKLWAFHGDTVVCLMGGWTCRGLMGGVHTTLDQCRLNGPVLVGTNDKPVEELAAGEHRRNDVRWVLHNGVGYIPLEPATLALKLGPVTGSWSSINRQYSDDPVTEPVFLAAVIHGSDPLTTGFAIAPGTDRRRINDLARNPVWRVIRNDAGCQSLSLDGGIWMAALYTPGERVADGEMSLGADKPCIALWTERELWLSDPTNGGCIVSVDWNGSKYSFALPPEGKIEHIERQ